MTDLPDDWLEKWKARRAAEAAKVAHRKVPMPTVPPGVCRWCEHTILGKRGKYIGKPDPRRSWCRGEGGRYCWREFARHSMTSAQYSFLAERDGAVCAECVKHPAPPRWYRDGPDMNPLDWSNGSHDAEWLRCLWKRSDAPDCRWLGLQTPVTQQVTLEVDHVVPLWKVALMPGMTMTERRRWFGPDNLQLLCRHHHGEKCAAEAAERAALKRLKAT